MMTRRSPLAWFILSLPGLLRRIVNASATLTQALKRWIVRRLSYYWTTSALEDSGSAHKKGSEYTEPPPKPLEKDEGTSATIIGKSDGGLFEKKTTDDEDLQYLPIIDGTTISLRDILPSQLPPLSLYPHSGGGIHNAIKSTRSLASSLSAHSRSVGARTPAQSMLGSSVGTRSSSSVNISVIAPDSPSPGSPVQQPSVPRITVDDSPSTHWSRPASPNGQQESESTSDAHSASGGSPASSIMLDTGPWSNEDSPPSPIADSGVEILSPVDNGSNGRITPPIPITPGFPTPVGFPTPDLYIPMPFFGPMPELPRLNDVDMAPIMPESILRYPHRPRIPIGVKAQPPIPPLTTRFGARREGWELCLHPEGARYFYNREKRIYVEADVDRFGKEVEVVVSRIEGFLRINRSRKTEDKDTDLVIWLRTPTYSNPNAKPSACYYFVHHPTQTIFFVDDYEPQSLSAYWEVRDGHTSQMHLGQEIEAQYWFHCQLFPHSLRPTKTMVDELRGVVLHFIGDTMTSPKCSTSPYTLDELHKVRELISEIEKYPLDSNVNPPPPGSVGASSCFARLAFIFARARFLNFHGEPHARLDRTATVYGDDPHRRTLLIKSLSLVLFFEPDFYLRSLQGMWVDNITHKAIFQDAVVRMNESWYQCVLLATVTLAVNVGFWSIQSSNISPGPTRSAAQISSYISAFASIVSIVVGWLLKRHNQITMRETADDFEKYMTSRNHKYLGLEKLAILYSIPFGLFMWAIMSFLLALSFLCFMKSSKPAIAIIGVIVFFCVLIVLWCVWANWEKEEEDPPKPEWLEQPNSLVPSADDPNVGHLAHHSGNVLGTGSYEMENFSHSHLVPNPHSLQIPDTTARSQPTSVRRLQIFPSIRSLRSSHFPEQRSDPSLA